jgi:hypothetical protein
MERAEVVDDAGGPLERHPEVGREPVGVENGAAGNDLRRWGAVGDGRDVARAASSLGSAAPWVLAPRLVEKPVSRISPTALPRRTA